MTEAPDIFFWGIYNILTIPLGAILLWKIFRNTLFSK